jgi:hypothetical protein
MSVIECKEADDKLARLNHSTITLHRERLVVCLVIMASALLAETIFQFVNGATQDRLGASD